MSQPIIQIQHLNKTFGQGATAVHALDDINLEIQSGEIFGIIGLSGAGKSTALKNMARELGQEGADVLVTREPGGSGLGKALRTLLLDCNSQITPDAELCLFLADRAQHVAEVIRPALAAGKVVLCDRYADSTYAYQGFARGMDLGRLRLLNDAVTGGLRPDLTLVFDVPEEEGLARARARNQSEGSETLKFHAAVRGGFLKLAAAEPQRMRIIDSTACRADVLARCLECYRECRDRLSRDQRRRANGSV